MVVNIRGTGGSGKSTVVRRVMELYAAKIPTHVDGRKQPYFYTLYSEENEMAMEERKGRTLFVPGHYEIPTGGCDTVKTVDEVYALLQGAVDEGADAIFEGIIVQDDVTRAVEFSKRIGRENFLVIVLTTPLPDCLVAINERRAARGQMEPVDPKNTTSRANRVTRIMARLRDAGVTVEKHDRESAFQRAKEVLGWAAK